MSVEPRRIALLLNPTAGKGRGARAGEIALSRLRAHGCQVQALCGRDADHALALASEAVADEVDALVVVGGDGMVNLGVRAAAGTTVPLGIVPAGTGNDVARYLDLPPRDPAAAADRVARGRRRRLDLARCGDRPFVTVLAAGFDAVVNERANQMTWPRGQMRYNLATVGALRDLRPLTYHLELDGVRHRVDAVVVAVGNGPSFGGGLRVAEGARLDDGLLDVVVIGPVNRRELLRTYPRLFTGTHVRHPQFSRHRVRSVTVAAPGIVGYADGERFGPLPLTVRAWPAALEVLA